NFMSKAQDFSRREFVRTGAVAAATLAMPAIAFATHSSAAGAQPQFQFGIASYTFRAFPRAQLIGFLKQLQVRDMNLKDTKDHLPMDPGAESAALADYSAAGIKVHAAGTIYFDKDEDDDIRKKFEYAKRADVKVIVSGDPAPTT